MTNMTKKPNCMGFYLILGIFFPNSQETIAVSTCVSEKGNQQDLCCLSLRPVARNMAEKCCLGDALDQCIQPLWPYSATSQALCFPRTTQAGTTLPGVPATCTMPCHSAHQWNKWRQSATDSSCCCNYHKMICQSPAILTGKQRNTLSMKN